jgi:hypothetical protein
VSPPRVKEEKREVPGNVATPVSRNRSRHIGPRPELLRLPASPGSGQLDAIERLRRWRAQDRVADDPELRVDRLAQLRRSARFLDWCPPLETTVIEQFPDRSDAVVKVAMRPESSCGSRWVSPAYETFSMAPYQRVRFVGQQRNSRGASAGRTPGETMDDDSAQRRRRA